MFLLGIKRKSLKNIVKISGPVTDFCPLKTTCEIAFQLVLEQLVEDNML